MIDDEKITQRKKSAKTIRLLFMANPIHVGFMHVLFFILRDITRFNPLYRSYKKHALSEVGSRLTDRIPFSLL